MKKATKCDPMPGCKPNAVEMAAEKWNRLYVDGRLRIRGTTKLRYAEWCREMDAASQELHIAVEGMKSRRSRLKGRIVRDGKHD